MRRSSKSKQAPRIMTKETAKFKNNDCSPSKGNRQALVPHYNDAEIIQNAASNGNMGINSIAKAA